MNKMLLVLLSIVLPSAHATRETYALESYEMSQLQVKSVAINEKCRFAYVRGPDQAIHIAQIGSYIGKNHGIITKIEEKFVTVRELIRDEKNDDWIDREVRLEVKQPQAPKLNPDSQAR